MKTRLLLAACLLGLALLPAGAAKRPLPERGICAHRGASHTHPENTLAALHEAVRLGAHQIEIDLQMTRDRHLVLMHDSTVTRTTNAKAIFPGRASYSVSDFTLAELNRLDAGAWKHSRFAGEQIPTFEAAIQAIPSGIWVNLDIKENGDVGVRAAREVIRLGIEDRAILSVRGTDVDGVRRLIAETGQRLLLNNMNRKPNLKDYIQGTIQGGFDFIQINKMRPSRSDIETLRAARVRINYCCTNEPGEIRSLLQGGIHFPLVDDVAAGVAVCRELGLPEPVR